jgi:hypothetical protein
MYGVPFPGERTCGNCGSANTRAYRQRPKLEAWPEMEAREDKIGDWCLYFAGARTSLDNLDNMVARLGSGHRAMEIALRMAAAWNTA